MRPTYNPAFAARVIVDKVGTNQLTTPGQWQDLVYQISRLPPRLEEWTWSQLEEVMAPDAYQYLRTWATSAGEVYTVASTR